RRDALRRSLFVLRPEADGIRRVGIDGLNGDPLAEVADAKETFSAPAIENEADPFGAEWLAYGRSFVERSCRSSGDIMGPAAADCKGQPVDVGPSPLYAAYHLAWP